MKKLLTNKLFMVTFFSDMLSNFGDVVYYLALMNYVLILPNAKFAISLITLSETVPYLTMLTMGVWADRTKNKLDRILVTLVLRVILYVIVGISMGFAPSLWVVILAVVANLLSDLSGQYENALYVPVSLRVVGREDREAMLAFRQGAGSLLQVLFQSSGAILVAYLSHQLLAFANAGTFLVSTLIMLALRPALSKRLATNPIQEDQVQGEQGQVDRSQKPKWTQLLKEVYASLSQVPILQVAIFIFAGLNAILVVQNALILLSMKEDASFVLVNSATTLATLAVIALGDRILGSILTTTLFKKVQLETLIKWSVVLPVGLFASLFFRQLPLLMLVSFSMMVISGVLMPKIQALVFNLLPEHKLATIGAGIDTLCTLGMVVSQLMLSGLVTFLPARVISLVFALLSVLLLGYTLTRKNQATVVQN